MGADAKRFCLQKTQHKWLTLGRIYENWRTRLVEYAKDESYE